MATIYSSEFINAIRQQSCSLLSKPTVPFKDSVNDISPRSNNNAVNIIFHEILETAPCVFPRNSTKGELIITVIANNKFLIRNLTYNGIVISIDKNHVWFVKSMR